MAGYASEDPKMINDALYGPGGTKEAPTGGLLKVHFGECIEPDGLWIEGAPGYQIGIASCGFSTMRKLSGTTASICTGTGAGC